MDENVLDTSSLQSPDTAKPLATGAQGELTAAKPKSVSRQILETVKNMAEALEEQKHRNLAAGRVATIEDGYLSVTNDIISFVRSAAEKIGIDVASAQHYAQRKGLP